jgi:hypothetical protein
MFLLLSCVVTRHFVPERVVGAWRGIAGNYAHSFLVGGTEL